MLSILSPAKSLDYSPDTTDLMFSVPVFQNDSAKLIKRLRELDPSEISSLMSISSNLAETNFERYQDWSAAKKITDDSKQAIIVFDGDVYKGFDEIATTADLNQDYLQGSLRILSGLYGCIKPFDLIKAYRLEMGTKLDVAGVDNLYEFWDGRVTEEVSKSVEESPGDNVLVNLASKEYSKVLDLDSVGHKVVAPVFKEIKDGKPPKIIAFYAKKARGAMAAWLAVNKVESIDDINNFDALGYSLDKELSSESEPVFTRTL